MSTFLEKRDNFIRDFILMIKHNIWWEIKDFFTFKLPSLYYNLFKYPWMIVHNVWDGKKHWFNSYYVWFKDAFPGWYKAFGKQFADEVQTEWSKLSKKDRDSIYIVQLKEKYASLRCYLSCHTKEIGDIIDKYEEMSYNYCINCGKPGSVREDLPWILTLCDACYKIEIEEREKRYDEWKREQGKYEKREVLD